ncbi:hypothetical protein ACRAKI_20100 [Saccharothrix isguenensis]
MPVRPGLVLHSGERLADPELAKYFEVNGWEVVEAVAPARWEHRMRLSSAPRGSR